MFMHHCPMSMLQALQTFFQVSINFYTRVIVYMILKVYEKTNFLFFGFLSLGRSNRDPI